MRRLIFELLASPPCPPPALAAPCGNSAAGYAVEAGVAAEATEGHRRCRNLRSMAHLRAADDRGDAAEELQALARSVHPPPPPPGQTRPRHEFGAGAPARRRIGAPLIRSEQATAAAGSALAIWGWRRIREMRGNELVSAVATLATIAAARVLHRDLYAA